MESLQRMESFTGMPLRMDSMRWVRLREVLGIHLESQFQRIPHC